MECCNKKRKSKFCPDCGRKLHELEPIMALLMHIERNAKIKKKELEQYNEKIRNKDVHFPSYEYGRRLARNAERWRGWSKALRDLLNDRKSPRQ